MLIETTQLLGVLPLCKEGKKTRLLLCEQRMNVTRLSICSLCFFFYIFLASLPLAPYRDAGHSLSAITAIWILHVILGFRFARFPPCNMESTWF